MANLSKPSLLLVLAFVALLADIVLHVLGAAPGLRAVLLGVMAGLTIASQWLKRRAGGGHDERAADSSNRLSENRRLVAAFSAEAALAFAVAFFLALFRASLSTVVGFLLAGVVLSAVAFGVWARDDPG